MRITERHLRKIIREVIKESMEMTEPQISFDDAVLALLGEESIQLGENFGNNPGYRSMQIFKTQLDALKQGIIIALAFGGIVGGGLAATQALDHHESVDGLKRVLSTSGPVLDKELNRIGVLRGEDGQPIDSLYLKRGARLGLERLGSGHSSTLPGQV